MSLKPLYDLDRAELAEACIALGHEKYRAKQLWNWLYRNRAATWEAMSNLPAALRDELAKEYALDVLRELEVSGVPGETRKILSGVEGGDGVETVCIPAGERRTVCLSSQVGCKFGCAFCASGQGGYARDLTAGEIVAQVLAAARVFGAVPTHVVYMGMGEPLDNYDAVLKSVRIINDSEGFNIGARRITISTAGLVPGIERLQGEGLQVELSVSLHAPDDELRSRLMPINKRYPLDTLMAACRAYVEATSRIITFEYTLVQDLNDSETQARALTALLRQMPCRVNVIPLSPVEEFEGGTPSAGQVQRFADIIQKAGINCTVRHSQGTRIDAACGQLRLRRKAGS